MKEIEVSNEQINMILNDSFDSNFWYYQLGLSVSDEDLTINNRFSFDFFSIGKKYWETLLDNLKNIICDRDKKIPSDIIDEILNGDIRNLITFLVTLLVKDLGVVIGVAIPLVALTIKTGIKEFCYRS